MTEREMLELAAKAAGAVHADSWDNGAMLVSFDGKKVALWNPRDDDGDSRRLANRLRMRVEHHVRHPFVAVFADIGFGTVKAEEPHLDDVDAATRLAVLRAAAEIGKTMP